MTFKLNLLSSLVQTERCLKNWILDAYINCSQVRIDWHYRWTIMANLESIITVDLNNHTFRNTKTTLWTHLIILMKRDRLSIIDLWSTSSDWRVSSGNEMETNMMDVPFTLLSQCHANDGNNGENILYKCMNNHVNEIDKISSYLNSSLSMYKLNAPNKNFHHDHHESVRQTFFSWWNALKFSDYIYRWHYLASCLSIPFSEEYCHLSGKIFPRIGEIPWNIPEEKIFLC